MAVKGTLAKSAVTEQIKTAFGEDFVGVDSGKIYVLADDGGEKVQIAISLTCPKIGLTAAAPVQTPTQTGAWDDTPTEAAQVTQEEMENVANLIKALGL